MEIGGYADVRDWPKMGPSLLIATCLIVAIRTAKWSATLDVRNSNCELDREIQFAANVAHRVFLQSKAHIPPFSRAANNLGTEPRATTLRTEDSIGIEGHASGANGLRFRWLAL